MTRRGEPWDRLPDESAPAWEAFKTYRDLGLTRSTAKVAQELGKSKALTDRWSARNSWVQRAAAWDSEQDRQWRLELKAASRKAADRNVRIASAAMGLVSKSIVGLVNQNTNLGANEIARLMEAASKLERLTLGDPTEHIRVDAGDGTDVADLEAMSDEEIRLQMEMLRRELDAELAEYDEDDEVDEVDA